jgi:hypothetical protein
MLAFVSFAPTLDPFGEGTEVRCVPHACVSYVFNGTLARRKKTILGELAIIVRVRHDTPHSPGNGIEQTEAVGSTIGKMQQLRLG